MSRRVSGGVVSSHSQVGDRRGGRSSDEGVVPFGVVPCHSDHVSSDLVSRLGGVVPRRSSRLLGDGREGGYGDG